MEWLVGVGAAPALIGQPVTYKRSSKLQTDWDIGLALPVESVKFYGAVGSARVRVAVGKTVYFDDRIEDGQLDWSCRAPTCDQVKAVSAQYVVYVEEPLYCQGRDGVPARLRIAAGYHYFDFSSGTARELGRGESMTFAVGDHSLAEAYPLADLQTFVTALLRQWTPGPFGC